MKRSRSLTELNIDSVKADCVECGAKVSIRERALRCGSHVVGFVGSRSVASELSDKSRVIVGSTTFNVEVNAKDREVEHR